MDAPEPVGPPAGEGLALSAWECAPPPAWDDLRAQRLEFTSRGDRVPARLLLPPAGAGPFPVVLLQHGAGGSKEADYLDATAGPWVRGGAAVLSIDFPLHGERRSDKLSERLLRDLERSLTGRGPHGPEAALWREFARQAVLDLRRALDAAEALPELDAGRSAFAGFSLGAVLGGIFLGADPRPRAAVLAIGGGGFAPAGTDPVEHVARFAPRPLLFVNAERDERIPRRAAEALHAAAGDPKRVEWFDCTHSALPGRALKSMWGFLQEHLQPL